MATTWIGACVETSSRSSSIWAATTKQNLASNPHQTLPNSNEMGTSPAALSIAASYVREQQGIVQFSNIKWQQHGQQHALRHPAVHPQSGQQQQNRTWPAILIKHYPAATRWAAVQQHYQPSIIHHLDVKQQGLTSNRD
ncbi:hypothetical protein ACLOJK_040687, partial [Asimina triloba]